MAFGIIQGVYDGMGAAASAYGLTYSVYRINAKTTGAVIDPVSEIIFRPVYKASLTRTTSREIIENTAFENLVFEGTCNGLKLKPGDILVETDPKGDGGQYAVAQIRTRVPYGVILMRVENNMSIERPYPTAGALNQQPVSGAAYKPFASGDYGGVNPDKRQVLTLDNGYYTIQDPGVGTRASLPIGMQPLNRVKDGHKLGLPITFARTTYVVYIPLTPGYTVAELDVLKAQNADTYEIRQVYTSTPIGLQGTIAIIERMNT